MNLDHKCIASGPPKDFDEAMLPDRASATWIVPVSVEVALGFIFDDEVSLKPIS